MGEVLEGLNPSPPDLKEVVGSLEARELFWVVKNGINMTGMPSFGQIGVPDQEVWSMAAFLKKLPGVSDQDYKTWTASGANLTLGGRPRKLYISGGMIAGERYNLTRNFSSRGGGYAVASTIADLANRKPVILSPMAGLRGYRPSAVATALNVRLVADLNSPQDRRCSTCACR